MRTLALSLTLLGTMALSATASACEFGGYRATSNDTKSKAEALLADNETRAEQTTQATKK